MATTQLAPVAVGIRNVLIATDFSPYSNTAMDFGLRLANDYSANAYIVFVVPNDQYLLAGPEAYVAARDAAQRDLEELQAELRKNPRYGAGNCHLYLLDGEIARAILDFAHRRQADLIVLGTHGRGGLRKAMLGSVAENVFRHSPVPVLTLGPDVGAPGLHDPPREILVAADFTPASQQALRYAAGLARKHQSNLTLLHVLDPRQIQHVPDRAAVEHGLVMRLTKLARQEAEDIHCAVRVEAGPVTQTILDVAQEQAADLLVLGVRPSVGVLDRLMFPHAYEIVRGAPCPVLTLREAKSSSD